MKSQSLTIKTTLTLLLSYIVVFTHGNSVFDLSTPTTFVNDYADLLTTTQEERLEAKVVEFDKSTSNQIAIVTVESLEGLTSSDFAYKLAEKWGVGQKDKNNGVLILVKPKYKHEKGQVYIAVGYGLEHVIPDAKAKRMVENILIPAFKKKRFYQGLDKTIDKIFSLTSEEYENTSRTSASRYVLIIVLAGISFLLLPIIYLIYLRKRKIPDEYDYFYIQGEYNAENLLAQIELMEHKLGHSYSKFKRQISQYNRSSHNNILKYSSKIDRTLFCYLLNGRKRIHLFWQMADPFLLFIVAYLVSCFISASIYLLNYSGFGAFLVSLGISFLVFYGLFGFLTSFLEIFQFVLRKNSKYVGGVSVALFAINALFKRKIKRKYNAKTNTYTYYPHVIIYSGGSGIGGYGGGYGGGFSGGGFGGGSFGGGGAGGSW